MSDINQRLLKRKIAKKHQYINTKLKVKKKYQKMTEKEGYQVIPLAEENDPMLQKRLNIYNEIFSKVNEEQEEQEEQPQQKKNKAQKNENQKKPEGADTSNSGVDASKPQVKTKEEIEREKKKKMKERQKIAKKHNERTKKGQPVMKNYINSLLQKVQKIVQK